MVRLARNSRIFPAIAVLLAVAATALAGAQGISRDEIQRFFINDHGNSVLTRYWEDTFHNREVEWEGMVYDIKRRPESHRVEIMVKVLPDSLLYDTLVVLEGRTRLPQGIGKGTPVRFRGKIINGTDVIGVKQVHVLLRQPEDIAPSSNIHPASY